jgi:hypothetical protein
MPDVFVEAAKYARANAPKTWGELLDAPDTHLIPQGLPVTAVRPEGVDEPAFRSLSVGQAFGQTQRQDHA